MSPLFTLVGLLWASASLWPPSALVPLLAARVFVQLAGLPCPRHEHLEVIPDHHSVRVLVGVARHELAVHPKLAAALERLAAECEEAHWYGSPPPDARALLARERNGRMFSREAVA